MKIIIAALAALCLVLTTTVVEAALASTCNNLAKGRLKSLSGTNAVSFSIFNASSTPKVINWIDYKGRAKTYAFLRPGEGLEQQSYQTHVWAVLDQVGNCVNVYQLGEYNLNIRLSD